MDGQMRSVNRGLVRASLRAFLVLALALPAGAWDRGNLADYHERRAKLVSLTGDGVVILFGYHEADVAASVTTFRQNEAFYYLTGWNQPDAILMLIPKTRSRAEADESPQVDKEILFIPSHDYREEKWTGPKLGGEDSDAPAQTGFPTVKNIGLFHSELLEALKRLPRVYTELTPQPESGEDGFIQDEVGKLKQAVPFARLEDIRPLLTQMRAVKSPAEIALMRKAVEASVEAHLAAMKAVKPGAWEYEIAALMQYEYERRGCEWPSYPPIVGSGFYSTILHYNQDDHQMQADEVVVMDVAGSYSGYASDITRTLPVNGHFTPRQRELYESFWALRTLSSPPSSPGSSRATCSASPTITSIPTARTYTESLWDRISSTASAIRWVSMSTTQWTTSSRYGRT
jgi:Xaa-Pro aminopeptidase